MELPTGLLGRDEIAELLERFREAEGRMSPWQERVAQQLLSCFRRRVMCRFDFDSRGTRMVSTNRTWRAPMTAILLSVHPRHAEAILEGSKTVELRRSAPTLAVHTAVLYATAPVQKIVGWFDVEEIRESPVGFFATTLSGATGITAEECYRYFEGLEEGYGIYVAWDLDETMPMVERRSEPLALQALGIHRPPQSWQYLTDKQLATVRGSA